jgi:hypothetical protein
VPISLRVGTFTPSVLLRVTRATGRLQDAGLAVTESAVASSPAQFEAVLGGDLDAVLTSPDNVLAYRYSPTNPLGRTVDARIVSAVDRGMGLALYGRADRGGSFGVDVPTSGFAFAMYALAERLGLARTDYRTVTLGSTPRRLEALLAGRCDATMLNAGNELHAEAAGFRPLARVSETCGPYLGTVLAVVGDRHADAARRLARALTDTAASIVAGHLDADVLYTAATALALPAPLAGAYLDRLKDSAEGLVPDGVADPDSVRTVVDLRRRYRPATTGGVDPFEAALGADPGLWMPG